MEKIQELVKEGKLSKSLMEDKEFVDGAKEIFKSENIGMDDKKLAELMDQIEAQLKSSAVLNDKALEEVSGGVSGKSVARKIIKAVTTTTGAVVGSILSGTGGAGLSGAVCKFATRSDEKIYTAAKIGAVPSVAFGGTTGGYAGYELGKWICKKTGLNED